MITQGTVLKNTYQIMEMIGAGGGGTIYKAYHLGLKKFVVVKRVKDNWASIMDSEKEAAIIKNLKHQYLPQAYDFIRLPEGIFTVIDYIPGYSLDKYLFKQYRFTQQQILHWLKQAAEALIYLHSQQPPIIHSDIKPANIMITTQGNICLIDFNVSLTSTPDSTINATSRGYASPEQYLNLHPINQPQPGIPFVPQYHFDMTTPLDARSDIYSLGATFYHLMTLQRPPRMPEHIPEIPDTLEGFDETLIHIVNKMTRYDPRERYQTAQELLNDLQNIRKLDKRSIAQRRSRLICNTVFPIIMAGAIVMSVAGYLTMGQEAEEAFQEKVTYADNCTDNQEYEKAQQAYEEAMGMKPEDISPYFGMMSLYTSQGDFESAVRYGKDTLAEHSFKDNTDKERADFYYILGNAYFEQEQYEEAVTQYTQTVSLNRKNPEYYRDYAIALARSAYVAKAKEILEEAHDLGLENDSVALVNAEIAFAENRTEDAISYFRKAIDQSSNENLIQRAYLYLCRTYQKTGKYDDLIDTITTHESLFNTYRKKVSKLMCAEAYLSKAENTPEANRQKLFAEKAIDLYNEVRQMGPVSKTSQFNLATAYEYTNDFTHAEEVLTEMVKTYPNDPDVYARLAILEADQQGQIKEVSSRDYTKFKEYYDKAEQLNQTNKVNGTSSAVILQMEQLMQEIKDNNWLKE